MKIASTFIGVLLTLLLACDLFAQKSTNSTPPAASPRATAPSVADVRADIEHQLTAAGIPGAGLVLLRGDEVAFAGGIGLADKASVRSADAHTRFRIGSISKMFVAIAIMQLVEGGKLTLDTPVHDLAPELPISNRWEASNPIRVVHLLEHTAGFDDMHFKNFHHHGSTSLIGELMHFDYEMTSRWPPGERFAYANPGYGVAAYLVEKISGQEYRQYVRDNIWKPLAMDETFWDATDAGAAMATGYGDDGLPRPFDEISLYPAGAVVSTPSDMAKLLRWFASHGTSTPGVISEAAFSRMEHPESPLSARAGLDSGYGLANAPREKDGVVLHGHDGGITGFSATLRYSAEPRLGYVVMINRMDGGVQSDIEQSVMAFLTQGLKLPEPGEHDTPHGDLSHLQGWYQFSSPRNDVMAGIERILSNNRIDVEGDEVVFRHPLFGEMARYKAVSKDRMRLQESVEPTAIATPNQNGIDTITTRTQFYEKLGFLRAGLPIYAFFAALLLLLSSVMFSLIWLPRMLFGRLRSAPHKATRILPWLASVSFLGAMFSAVTLPIDGVFTPNRHTIGIFAFTLLFALASALALAQSLRPWRAPMNRLVRWHCLLVSIAASGLTLWLASTHLLGLRTWAW